MADSLQARPPFEGASLSMADGENLLTNPGFEEGFSIREDPAVNVANGWEPWYVTGAGFGIRPEWNQEQLWLPSIRVLHGDYGQKMFNTWGVHTAGIYQQVAVPEGSLLEFSIWVQVWSSDCDDICVSPLEPCHPPSPNSHGNYRVSVGIDPTGGTDPLAEGVIWSDETVYYDRWVRLVVYATAQAETVTVFTRGRPEWGVKHNDSYWDSASLRVISLDQFAFLPLVLKDLVGPTPMPTATFTPTATATATATPTSTPTVECQELVPDGDFETVGAWELHRAETSTAQVHGGERSVLLGLTDPAQNAFEYSSAKREITLPADAITATLTFWTYPLSQDMPFNDLQLVRILDTDDQILATLVRQTSNAQAWIPSPPYSLRGFAGQTIRLYFAVKNDGEDGVTAMYVDDVSLEICRAPGLKGVRRAAPWWLVSADGGVGITYIRYSLTQPDIPAFPPSCDPLTFEFVQLQNFGEAVDVGGWTLEDAEGHLFTFPSLILEPGDRVRVWSRGAFPNENGWPTDLFWGSGAPIWNDDHDTAILRDNFGTELQRISW